ncbi:MAG: metallophosphoesterase [Tepidisphaeraceae bacterium]|jgi:3',5'-cyclic AMP phosphodiesterase CpdA
MTTIVHISDLHFGRHDPAATQALAVDIAAIRPDVIVNSGDFTQRSRRRQWALARDFVATLPAPQVCVPGNHDIPLFDVFRRILSPLGRFRSCITTEPYPVWTSAGAAIVGVCTARPIILNPLGFWKDGALSDAQLAEIAARLAPADPSALRVVAAHHPLVPPRDEKPRHHLVWRVRQALDAFADCGVDVVLSGHLHLSYTDESLGHHSGTRRSILCIQAGTAISSRRRSRHPNAFNRILVHSRDHVGVEVREFDGGAFVARRTTDWQRVNGIWRMSGSRD